MFRHFWHRSMTFIPIKWLELLLHGSFSPRRWREFLTGVLAKLEKFAAMNHQAAPERLTCAIREWLLAILRFAITLEPADRAKVLVIARELDQLGQDSAAKAFAFFTRTSFDLCNAIADKDSPGRGVILRRQLLRIGDTRLRSALEAAIDWLGHSKGAQTDTIRA